MGPKRKQNNSGRRNQNRVSAKSAVRSVIEWRTFRPPVRQPTVNRSFVFPLTVFLGKLTTVATNWLIRVEDILTSVWKTIDMTYTWAPSTTVSIRSVMAYSVISGYDKTWVPSMTLVIFDPLTNAEVKSMAALGDIDDPPRLGYHFPAQAYGHLLHWDGVASTSAQVVGIQTTDVGVDLNLYFDVVIHLKKPFVPTEWDSPEPVLESTILVHRMGELLHDTRWSSQT